MQLITRIDEEEILRELFLDLDMCDPGRHQVIQQDHESFEFVFHCADGETEHEVNLEGAIEGFQAFVLAVHASELCDITDLNTDIIGDPDNWENSDIDLLLQFIIDGKVVGV